MPLPDSYAFRLIRWASPKRTSAQLRAGEKSARGGMEATVWSEAGAV